MHRHNVFVLDTPRGAQQRRLGIKRTGLIRIFCSYLPAIGRFLIVVTFLEDALRIVTQWTDQLTYLHDYRKSMPRYFTPHDMSCVA